MADYTSYIDFGAIHLGDLASEIGDYQCAVEQFRKALKKLNGYQGDQMHPIFMAGELKRKIETAESNRHLGKSFLKFDTWKLTKSSFVKGNNCVKSLYLDKFKRIEKNVISKELQAIFDKGHSFEDNVRLSEFPGGINIKEKVQNFAYFNSYTNYLLHQTSETILYEATLIEEDVLVMCDILVKDENGLIDIYEIKLNSEPNEAILSDLAIQFTICKKRFGNTLRSFNLILRSTEEDSTFKIHDLTNDLTYKVDSINEKIKEFKSILSQAEPEIEIGSQCHKPYECDFTGYCGRLKGIEHKMK
jgi:hypothetical protein